MLCTKGAPGSRVGVDGTVGVGVPGPGTQACGVRVEDGARGIAAIAAHRDEPPPVTAGPNNLSPGLNRYPLLQSRREGLPGAR